MVTGSSGLGWQAPFPGFIPVAKVLAGNGCETVDSVRPNILEAQEVSAHLSVPPELAA